jgi:hypothetical protein
VSKILFVDDEPERHWIFDKKVKTFLKNEFSNIVVHHSKGRMLDGKRNPLLNLVESGVRYGDVYELIKQSIRSNTPYDIVVLDVRLESQPDSWTEGVDVAKEIRTLHKKVDYPFFVMISRHEQSKDVIKKALYDLAGFLRYGKFDFFDVDGEEHPGWGGLYNRLRAELTRLNQQPQRTKVFEAEAHLVFEPLTQGDDGDLEKFRSGAEYCTDPIRVYEVCEGELAELLQVKANSPASILLQFLSRDYNVLAAFRSGDELLKAVNAERPGTFVKASDITNAFSYWVREKFSKAWKRPLPGHTGETGFGLAANVEWRRVPPNEVER